MTTKEKSPKDAQGDKRDATLRNMQKIWEYMQEYERASKKSKIPPPTLQEIAVGIGKRKEDKGNIQPLVQQLIREGFLVNLRRYGGLRVADKPPRKVYYKGD